MGSVKENGNTGKKKTIALFDCLLGSMCFSHSPVYCMQFIEQQSSL